MCLPQPQQPPRRSSVVLGRDTKHMQWRPAKWSMSTHPDMRAGEHVHGLLAGHAAASAHGTFDGAVLSVTTHRAWAPAGLPPRRNCSHCLLDCGPQKATCGYHGLTRRPVLPVPLLDTRGIYLKGKEYHWAHHGRDSSSMQDFKLVPHQIIHDK